jgi:hypothetical protein
MFTSVVLTYSNLVATVRVMLHMKGKLLKCSQCKIQSYADHHRPKKHDSRSHGKISGSSG